MRNGQPYDPMAATVAVGVDDHGAPALEMGTLLLLCSAEACAEGIVADTGLMSVGDLDLSSSLFNQLDELSRGRIKIEYIILSEREN